MIATYIAPVLEKQFTNLVDNIPQMVSGAQELIAYVQDNQNLIPEEVNRTIDNFTSNLQTYIESAMSFIFGFISEFIGFIFALVLIPFSCFYAERRGKVRSVHHPIF